MKSIFLFILSALLLCSFPLHAEVFDRVVASIGDDAITLFDIDREAGPLLKQYKKDEKRLYETRKAILEKLIEKVLLMREARLMGLEVSKGEVTSAVDNIKRENKIGHDELVRALAQEGMTYEKYVDELKGQILRSKVLDRKVRGSINISDDDISFYYEKNRDIFKSDEEIRVRHILFLVPKEAGEEKLKEVKTRAEAVLKLARGGENFEALAKKHSQGPSASSGGDLGYFRKEDMVKEFSRAAFALNVNEVSDLVLSPFGFHIIKMMDRRGGKAVSFDDVKGKIKAILFSEEMEKGAKSYIEELKDTNDLKILL
ncbi:MAG: peptidylprolyl isomerase [Deltaproteobacteria bacterium]|nr:peptidylprolyl isomerase [Deltaproteobacteria bacterium]